MRIKLFFPKIGEVTEDNIGSLPPECREVVKFLWQIPFPQDVWHEATFGTNGNDSFVLHFSGSSSTGGQYSVRFALGGSFAGEFRQFLNQQTEDAKLILEKKLDGLRTMAAFLDEGVLSA
ncbi:MAG: hypothetical protein WC768_00600 [Patescibacteria group bacterium]|jgi:hypothetical protein